MKALSRMLIIIIFISFLSCSNESPLEINSKNDFKENEEFFSINKKMPPVPDIVLADERFEVSVFYDSIMGVDGIAALSNSKVLAVQEWGYPGQCVFLLKKGHTFDVNDVFTTIGPPFVSPDDILVYLDGTVFVADGQAQSVFKIAKHGGSPEAFITPTSSGSPSFNPFGLAIAPANFDGPNVDPGDIIVADNGYGTNAKAVWAVNPYTGVSRIIAQGSVFIDGPILVDFSSDGTLYIYQNRDTGTSRIVTLSANGTVTTFFEPIYASPSLAIHPKTDDIFFKKVEGEIHRIPKTGGTPQIFASNIGNYQDIAFNKQGTALYLGYRDNYQVVQISASQKTWE